MATTYSAPEGQPPGTFKRVVFPQLAMMDTWTDEGPFQRRLESAGGRARNLPRTIFAQFRNDGHDGAEIVGTLTEVTLGDDGVLSGAGWLLDDENGHRLVRYHAAGALKHNSVDLANVDYRVNVDFQFDQDFTDADGKEWFAPIAVNLSFNKWAVGSTTFVALPAFEDAHGDPEEIAAAMNPDVPMVWTGETRIVIPDYAREHITASAVPLPKWEDFHVPEAEVLTKATLSADGVLTGHLAAWNSCHDGILDRCVRVPTPTDNYASFNKPGVLTDRGIVDTGPITLVGGHVRNMADMAEACNNVENAWADVRVIPGRLGPWMSGRVRPHITEADQYVARASRFSGWWSAGRLKGICSVNMEGFDVPGSGEGPAELAAAFVGHFDDDGEITELVAGLPPCELSPKSSAEVAAWDAILPKIHHYMTMNTAGVNTSNEITVTVEETTTTDVTVELVDDDGAEIEAELLALDEDESR